MQITGGSLATLNFYTQPYNSNNNRSNNKTSSEKIAKSLQPQKQLMLLAERSLKGTRRESEDEQRAPA